MKIGIDYSETCGVCNSQIVIQDALRETVEKLLRDWRKVHYRCITNDQNWRKPIDTGRIINDRIKL